MSRLAFLRADAVMVCTHETGIVALAPSQTWVRSGGVPLLVYNDPEGKGIGGCPNLTVVTKPCTLTLKARDGYSSFISVGGSAVCLETVIGGTDGTGGVFDYKVNYPGQILAGEVSP